MLAFFLKSREKAYLVPALFFTASASELIFRAIASLGAHGESRVVPETCGVTHCDCVCWRLVLSLDSEAFVVLEGQ